MRVKFINSKDKLLLGADMEAPPRRDEMVVIGEVIYETLSIKHIFTPTGRSGQHAYLVEVQIKPI